MYRMQKGACQNVVTVCDELGYLTACSTLDHLLPDRNIVEQEPDLYTYLHHSKITVVQKNINSFQTITQQRIAKPLKLRRNINFTFCVFM